MTLEAIIAFTTLLIAVAGGGGGVVWQMSRNQNAVLKSISDLRKDMDDDLASMERRFGETIAAVREKLNKVELDAAQTYLRRDGFYKVQEQIAQAMEKMQQSIDGRFVRIEEKLDQIRGRQ